MRICPGDSLKAARISANKQYHVALAKAMNYTKENGIEVLF
jgi:hypothetical protein